MKYIFRIIAGTCVAFLLTLHPGATVKAEPLTVIAIAGLSAVVVAGGLDAAFVDHQDSNKDMRAEVREQNSNQEEIAPAVKTTDSDLGYFARNGHVNVTDAGAIDDSYTVHGYYGTGISGASGD